MTRRTGGAQVAGAILLLLVACFAAVQLVFTIVDEYISWDWIAYDITPAIGYWGLVVQALGRVVCVGAAATALVALSTRSVGAARGAGLAALLSFVLLLVGEALLIADVPEFRFEVVDDIVYGWVWTFTDIVAVLVGAVLLLAAPRSSPDALVTSSPAAYAAAPVATPSPSTGTLQVVPAEENPRGPAAGAPSSYFIQVDGVEYGPFDAETIRAYVAEGRVVPSTLIRPAAGYFEAASSVPGLFVGEDEPRGT